MTRSVRIRGGRAVTLSEDGVPAPGGEAAGAVGEDGWLPGATRVPSPNCDARPDAGDISLVVVHAISLPPEMFGGPGVVELFTNALDPAEHPYYAQIQGLRVSAHFFVRRDGAVIQFVPTTARAWHAGVSQWAGRERCNDFSVGIELEGSDLQGFEPVQMARLAALVQALTRRHPIVDIAGHSDIAPGRKTDPGPYFEWDDLAARLACSTR